MDIMEPFEYVQTPLWEGWRAALARPLAFAPFVIPWAPSFAVASPD